MTQYGEDNPDEDFFEGAKFMAIKILDREARTQNEEIDYKAYNSSSRKSYCRQCSRKSCQCNCKKRECDCELEDSDFDPEDIDNSDNLEEFDDGSDVTDDDEVSDEIEGPIVPNECDCLDRSYSAECDCEKCNCAQTKLQESSFYEIYEKYHVWKSQTPGGLVEELAEKIVELRGGPYVSPSKRPVSVSQKVDKYGPDGVGPWG